MAAVSFPGWQYSQRTVTLGNHKGNPESFPLDCSPQHSPDKIQGLLFVYASRMSPFSVQKVPLVGAAEVLRWAAEVALGRSSKETSIIIGVCLRLRVLLAKCGPNTSQAFVNKGSHLLEGVEIPGSSQ